MNRCETCNNLGQVTLAADKSGALYACPDCRPTLRDFAAMSALQGLLAGQWQGVSFDGRYAGKDAATIAFVSYLIADAMVRARGPVADDSSGEAAAEVE